MTITGVSATTRDEVLGRAARRRALRARHARQPGRRRARLARRDAGRAARRSARTRSCSSARDEFPLPYEYAFFEFGDRLISDIPDDVAQRTIVFLDCGNFDRNAVEVGDALIVNIDHHHDNTRFGTINHVDDGASSTAEIVWDLMQGLGRRADAGDRRGAVRRPRHRHRAASCTRTPARARTSWPPTSSRRASTSTRPTAASTRACPEPKLALLTRALTAVERYDDGRLTLARLRREDFAETGAEESYTEGIIDHLRSVQGTKVAALARELTAPDQTRPLEGLAAGDRRRRRRVVDRARAGRRRPSPGRRLRDAR